MCNALDTDECFQIANLIHELGILYEKKKQAVTIDRQKRMEEEWKRVSAKLLQIGNKLEIKAHS